MSKALIIAEKPSVAADIARSLGDFVKHQDYFENDEYVLSSAVGHLLELRAPEQYDVKRGKWTFTHLPVIPPHFDLAPIARSEARLKVLMRLIKRKDIGQLINACDAGREGELIFRYIVQAAKAQTTGTPAMAAVDDTGFDSRSIRTVANRRRDDAAGGCRAQPLRGRLAGRHQRHACDDRLQ